MRTSVAGRAIVVTGWNRGRYRSSNHALPFHRIRAARLRLPSARGITMNRATL